MNRLTEDGWRNIAPLECCGQDRYCMRGRDDLGGCIGGCIVPKLYARLAAYEDTGLELEEIGNLVTTGGNGEPAFSFHVGDTIYLLVTRRKYLQTNFLHSSYIK